MKILVILLLSVAGPEEIELAKSPSISCGEAGNKWLEANTVYKDQINGDLSKQGFKYFFESELIKSELDF